MQEPEREFSAASAYVERDIPIANLKLDELNFRTDEVDGQRAAIKAMIQEQGLGLVRLAEHFLMHGLMPGERLLVIPDEKGESESFVVMEGNRRTTMMKILEQPDLAAETNIHARIVELARQFSGRPLRTLPCVILPQRRAALVWVEVKHSTGMGGAGVEKWSAPATARFSEYLRGRVSRWRATLRFLRERGIDVAEIADGIRPKTSAVSRVLNAGAIKQELGIIYSHDGNIEFENGDIDAGARLLNSLMEAMASPKFSTNNVHSTDDRVAYIRRFSALSVKNRPTNVDAEAGASTDGNSQEFFESESAGIEDGTGSQQEGPNVGGDPAEEARRETGAATEPNGANEANGSAFSDDGEPGAGSSASEGPGPEEAASAASASPEEDTDHGSTQSETPDQAAGDPAGEQSRGEAPVDQGGGEPSVGGNEGGSDTASGERRDGSAGLHRHPRQRTTLASTRRGEELKIADHRINQLYHEVRKLKVEQHTAVAAVLIRVFLELSCEYYLSREGVPVPDQIIRRNQNRPTNWHTFGVRFREKIEAAINHAGSTGDAQRFSEIRRGLGSQDHLHSPENLHDYVHGLKTIPSTRDLIIIWDRYHPLFAHMFS